LIFSNQDAQGRGKFHFILVYTHNISSDDDGTLNTQHLSDVVGKHSRIPKYYSAILDKRVLNFYESTAFKTFDRMDGIAQRQGIAKHTSKADRFRDLHQAFNTSPLGGC
jgi:hypothetical protein